MTSNNNKTRVSRRLATLAYLIGFLLFPNAGHAVPDHFIDPDGDPSGPTATSLDVRMHGRPTRTPSPLLEGPNGLQPLTGFALEICENAESFINVGYAKRIGAPADLDAVRNDLSARYIVTNDIDFTGVQFVPIGSSTSPFTGELWGCGHRLSNLSMSYPERDRIGIFEQVEFGSVSDLILSGFNVRGRSKVGTLAANIVSARLYNVHVESSNLIAEHVVGGLTAGLRYGDYSYLTAHTSITASGGIGGLAANAAGSISRCASAGTYYGRANIGGLFGSLYWSESFTKSYSHSFIHATGVSGTSSDDPQNIYEIGGLIASYYHGTGEDYTHTLFSENYAAGQISLSCIEPAPGSSIPCETSKVAGLIGLVADDYIGNLRIENVYSQVYIAADATVSPSASASGLISQLDPPASASPYYGPSIIKSSYAAGELNVNSRFGLVETISSSIFQIDVYWDRQLANTGASAVGFGYNSSHMTSAENLMNLDPTIWRIEEGKYPVFHWQ